MNVNRDVVGETAAANAKDRAATQVLAEMEEWTDALTFTGIVSGSVECGATVFKDEWKAHNPLENTDYRHGEVRHSVGQHVDALPHAKGIYMSWVLLNHNYHGTYFQMMSLEHELGPVDDFQERHNIKPSKTLDQVSRIVRHKNGDWSVSADLTADDVWANRMKEAA